ncbi:hypothetical protein SADUNF_Sadunf17G0120500 [Salix dunnii]|uniref:Disease resistance protein RGA3 n=1 Tax=Salix dunnii TaxID=1413687 RepID=A0A835J9A0_9ROSI|nr:hypothetical protein SADUNF_Sadunf17G0120500 [Salix dunnii]
MAEAVISTAVCTITKKLASLIQQPIELACGVEEQLKKLKNTLSTINSVIHDAEEEHDKNEEVRVWLGKLKEAVYDADDVIDEYQTDNVQRQVLVCRSLIKKVCTFCSLSNPILFRCQLGKKLKQIRKNIDEIAKDRSNFHSTVPSERVGKGALLKREQSVSDVSSEVIGREDDKEEIIKLLLSSNEKENVTIIPIVGMAGLGKTTLAQMVFNDDSVASHFEYRQIWISVSDDFNLRLISRKIAEKLDHENYGHLDLDLLQNLLKQKLSTSKYLLVLDDVWNEDRVKWYRLKDLLMSGARGSKVLVTTRARRIASMMATGTHYVYNLRGLPYDKCLDLFLSWAFERDQDRPQNLVAIGKGIVSKCGGLPLAARTLGCFLYRKDEDEWSFVKDSELWELAQKEDDILPVLRMTYDQMPHYLKPCFAFCSLFPKNHLIDKETLIHLWMAQGFLQSSDGSPLEKIGNRYFNELLSMSLLEEELKDHDDEATHCKMHDIIHDLAQLRKETVIDLLANLKCLRILILSESEFDGLPSSIGSLLHLRYLDLSMNRLFRRLPRSICKLQNLQTLRLYACVQLEELPKDTWKIATLRHLDITSNQDFLPKKGIECLTSLRSLSIYKCYRLSTLVRGMQHWTSLQKLCLIDCPRLSSLEFDLNSLISLETLEICNCSVLDLSGRLKKKDEDRLKGRRSLLSQLAGVNYRKEDKREQNEGAEKKEEGQQGLQKLRSLTFVQLPKLIELPYDLKNAASSLQCLSTSNCNNLSSLPDWLPQCTALKKLEIMKCKMLSLDDKDYEVRYIMISASQVSIFVINRDLADKLKELVQKKTLNEANTVDLDVLTAERSSLNEFLKNY